MPPRKLRPALPGPLERVADAPGAWLFAAAVLISGGTLLHYLSRLTFWRDEWGVLLHRRGSGLGVLFQPFVEQLLAIPVATYKILVSTFGMDSPFPFQLVATLLFLLSVVLAFVYARRRVGDWLALALTLPILFLGQSWDDLLFPFQMAFFGSLACGIGALLALDRDDRTGDWLAAALLTTALLFSDLGIPFVAGIALEIALRDDRFRRAYIVAIPTAMWALWYLKWGREAQNFVSFENFATTIGYVSDGLGSSLSSMLGLGAPRNDLAVNVLEGRPLDWGRALFVAALGFAVWRLVRMPSITRRLWAVLAIGLGFWALAGLNSGFFGQAPDVGRYQYVGAIFLVLIAADLLRGLRISRAATAIIVAVAVAATLANFNTLKQAGDGLRGLAQQQRGGLGALELVRGRVDPSFQLTQENSEVDYLGEVDAGSYFAAVDDYGSPAYDPAELARSSQPARIAADKVFASALGIGLAPGSGAKPTDCLGVKRDPAPVVIHLPNGKLLLRARGGNVSAMLRRYATATFPIDLGEMAPGSSSVLTLPRDRSSRDWKLRLAGPGSVSVCRVAGG